MLNPIGRTTKNILDKCIDRGFLFLFEIECTVDIFYKFCCKQVHPKRSLVVWMITLLLIICPSSYKAHPDNLIGQTPLAQLLHNGSSPDRTLRPQMLWVGLSSPGIQAISKAQQMQHF